MGIVSMVIQQLTHEGEVEYSELLERELNRRQEHAIRKYTNQAIKMLNWPMKELESIEFSNHCPIIIGN